MTASTQSPVTPEVEAEQWRADSARHRVPRQSRAGGPLLGVTAMAATFGASGLAAAPAAAAVSVPDEAPADESAAHPAADPGLALAARIQAQADPLRTTAEETARLAAAQDAEAKRADRQAEVRRADSAAFELPVTGYQLTAQHGQSGVWAHLHTGLDFAAPAGTPVRAVGSGTVTSVGWSGVHGYRVIETLADGTELWYCHLSEIASASGPVEAGAVLGRVGATGSVTNARLHLEVRPDGGAPVDPLPWLQARGLQP